MTIFEWIMLAIMLGGITAAYLIHRHYDRKDNGTTPRR